MPWRGFDPLTLGVASSDEDQYTMPLPQEYKIINFSQLQTVVGQNINRWQEVQVIAKTAEAVVGHYKLVICASCFGQ